MSVRVRMAPSPTGYFHLGSARTALFNWLFARQEGGVFVLRIEDTDAARDEEEWVEGIQSAMRWLGLDWDEGPYRQSERTALYLAAAERLLADGSAYWCDCTREDTDARKPEGAPPGYDGFCRDRALERGDGRAARFRTPDEGSTAVHDLVRGDPTFEHTTIEDFVILRSNGAPIFILANVVDDMDMRISHVIRGEDHLTNTPKYLLLWDALDGGERPVFAHLPLLVNEKRQKLSKRRDPVALEGYREEGYLPEAMRNYLALLGWAPKGDREILPIGELIAEFRLEEVNSSPAFFDVKKLAHVNGEYIRALPVAEFIERSRPWLESGVSFPAAALDLDVFASIAAEVQTRVETLAQVPGYVDFLFLDEPVEDDAAWQKGVVKVDAAAALLDEAAAAYADAAWDPDSLKTVLERIGEAHGLKLGKAQAPIRVAVTGKTVGPPLFESLVALGRDRTLARLRAARARFG